MLYKFLIKKSKGIFILLKNITFQLLVIIQEFRILNSIKMMEKTIVVDDVEKKYS